MTSVVTVPHIPTITATNLSNHVLTTNGWAQSNNITSVEINTTGVTLVSGGDIYQMSNKAASDGLFYRMERLERMMGILRRDTALENAYQPLKEAGDKYDKVLDDAIADIMNIAITTMKQHADDYEQLKTEAIVYRALTKDTDNDPRP